MASSSKKLTQCDMCHKNFDFDNFRPYVLMPCGHTLCDKCLLLRDNCPIDLKLITRKRFAPELTSELNELLSQFGGSNDSKDQCSVQELLALTRVETEDIVERMKENVKKLQGEIVKLEARLIHFESQNLEDKTIKKELSVFRRENETYQISVELLNLKITKNKILPNGNIYQGTCNESDQPHGRGILYVLESSESRGERYVGEFVNGQRSGHGCLTLCSGDTFTGGFSNDKANGFGTLDHPNGDKYEGEFCDGVKCGKGRYYYAKSGMIYEGDFLNDKQHGKGSRFYASETHFVSHQQETTANGIRPVNLNNKARFVGEFENSLAHGHGKLYFENGDIYDGMFKNGKSHDHGKMQYHTGNMYDGEWKDGFKDGRGKFFWRDGDRYEGEFKQGNMHGQGMYYFSSGKRHEGEWKNGKLFNGKVFDKSGLIKLVYVEGELFKK